MTNPVEVPLWLLLLMGAVTLWAILSRLLIPTVRWFFRRRLNRLIEEVNRRLHLQLPTFSLTRRQILVDRLAHDPRVLATVREHCRRNGTPWGVALRRVEVYAREIVPAFNAYIYFRIGRRIARALVQRFYHVRLVHHDRGALSGLDPDASVVFVMNHRSNMDYVLVAWLTEDQAALSYAVGEWARVWPLEPLVRAMGAYFVRRDSGNLLYRRVLERYVQMAVEGGVSQAVFPEGGLSRDGGFRDARVGLLDYMLRDFDPEGERDILFVPVGLSYDRVLEDRALLREAGQTVRRRSTLRAMGEGIQLLARNQINRIRGRHETLGQAAAGFGPPVSARAWCRHHGVDPRRAPAGERIQQTRAFAEHLLERIGAKIPVLPVPLLCWLIRAEPAAQWTRERLEHAYGRAVTRLDARAEPPPIPQRDPQRAVAEALTILLERGILSRAGDALAPGEGQWPLIDYYANGIDHLLASTAPPPTTAPGKSC